MFSSEERSVTRNDAQNAVVIIRRRLISFLFCAKFRTVGSVLILPLTLFLSVQLLGQSAVTTWHYDNARTSANANETILTPAKVNSTSFGKLATLPVDGFVVANPLYLPGVNVLGEGVHNVVYVVTLHDSVYAFDADSAKATPLWTTSILNYSPAGATPVPGSEAGDDYNGMERGGHRRYSCDRSGNGNAVLGSGDV